MGAAKVVDDVLNHAMRKYDPLNGYLLIAKKWKRVAGFFALCESCMIYATTQEFRLTEMGSDWTRHSHRHLQLSRARWSTTRNHILLENGCLGCSLRMGPSLVLVCIPIHDRI